MQPNMAKTDHKHSTLGYVSKAWEMKYDILGSALWENDLLEASLVVSTASSRLAGFAGAPTTGGDVSGADAPDLTTLRIRQISK
jgi:hypothetical protein